MDVSIVLDLSGSIDSLATIALPFIHRLVHGLPIEFNRARVALVTYSDTAKIHFALNRYSSKREILNALSFGRVGGRTNTAAALRLLRQEVYRSAGGDRAGVPNIGVVLTDGNSNVQRELTSSEARLARQDGIELYAVGVSDKVDATEIDAIASEPRSTHVRRARDAAEAYAAAESLLDKLCQ